MQKLIAVLLVALAACGTACATDYAVGPVNVQIPQGFEGPVEETQGQATVVAFRKSRPGSNFNTLFQITIYDFGASLDDLPAAQRGAASAKYLLEFIAGVEHRRTGFKRSDPKSLELSGSAAAKVIWTGRLGDQDTVGAMYCVVVGTRVISFHTQDVGSEPTPAMREAMAAIESAQIDDGP